jgi:hypothetical protein
MNEEPLMGYSGDIMHNIVQKELVRYYPHSEGWVLKAGSKKIGNDEIFTLTRRKGRLETASVGVTFSDRIAQGFIDALMSEAMTPDAKKSAWHPSVVVPQGAYTGNAPERVVIRQMRSFSYQNKDLIWAKRNIVQSVPKPA